MKRQAAIQTLRNVGWLSRQDADFQNEILQFAELRTYRDRATIQVAGDEPAGLFGLATGQLSVTIAPDALPHHLVQIAQPGWWFGDVALISDAVRVVTLIARGQVEILAINRSGILKLASNDPTTWKRIAQITVMHLDQALRIIGAMSLANAETRIAFALARLTEGYDRNSDEPIPVEISQAELGEMARMTRNAVHPILKKLESRGLLVCTYRTMTICSVRRLWHFIEAEFGQTTHPS